MPDVSARTVFEIANALYSQGYRSIYMVAGSDRVAEFQKLLNQYNGKPDKAGNELYKFDSKSHSVII